jgi:hypothetical protein
MLLPSRAIGAIALICLGSFSASADSSRAVPICDGKFGLCRYVDGATRKELIPARFEWARRFSEGLAAVRIDGRVGFIDAKGEMVIGAQFDDAGQFYQGLAEVLVGDKTGVIDRSGKIVVPAQFKRTIPLTSDVVLASEGNRVGDEKFVDQFAGQFTRSNDGPFGLYHVAGHWIRQPGLKRIAMFDREGRGLVWASEHDHPGAWGLLAHTGDWVIAPEFSSVAALRDQRAVVSKTIDGKLRQGAVDEAGRLAVPFQNLTIHGWTRGWGHAVQRGTFPKSALLDKDGAIIGGRFFDSVEVPKDGDIAIVGEGGRRVGLDRAGNIVPNPRNGRVLSSCKDGLRVVEVDGRIQITDTDGRATTPHLFGQLNRPMKCGVPYVVQYDQKYGHVKPEGTLMFDPPDFDQVREFEHGYAAVQRGESWGVIDEAGRFVLDLKYKHVIEWRDGLFHVDTGSHRVWINAAGAERPAPAQPPQLPSERSLNCGHGLRMAHRDGQWGIVDADGSEVIAPVHRAVSCFSLGLAWVPVDEKKAWCAVDRRGVRRETVGCQAIRYPHLPHHTVPEQFHDDMFENSVLWTRAYLEFGAGLRAKPPEWIFLHAPRPTSVATPP